MTVNPVIENANTQEAAVASNLGILSTSLVDKLQKNDDLQKPESPRATKETVMQKVLEGKSNASTGLELLKNFLSKAADIGVVLNPKTVAQGVKGKLGELEELFGKKENFEDLVEISKKAAERSTKQSKVSRLLGKSGYGGGGGPDGEEMGPQGKAALQQFVALCSEALTTNNPDKLKLKRELQAKLEEAGVSRGKLQEIEGNIRGSARSEIAEQIKNTLLLRMLAPRKGLERIMYERKANDLIDFLYSNGKLVEGDVKSNQEKIQQMVDMLQNEANQELKSFLPEELENLMIKKTLAQDTDFKDILKLIDIGAKAKFDAQAWIKEVWMPRKDDLGLVLIDAPPSLTGTAVDTNTDHPQRRPKHGYEFDATDEKELHINRLRALYMQKALKGGFRLDTFFKIQKSKQGLIRLGVFTKGLDKELKHEAKILAKMKSLEILNEALLERGTLYELAGPAFKLNEKKIKTDLRNLERLGMPISRDEFIQKRDAASLQMLSVAQRELEVVEGKLAHSHSPQAEKKQKLLIKLMRRLKEEVGEEAFNTPQENDIFAPQIDGSDLREMA